MSLTAPDRTEETASTIARWRPGTVERRRASCGGVPDARADHPGRDTGARSLAPAVAARLADGRNGTDPAHASPLRLIRDPDRRPGKTGARPGRAGRCDAPANRQLPAAARLQRTAAIERRTGAACRGF